MKRLNRTVLGAWGAIALCSCDEGEAGACAVSWSWISAKALEGDRRPEFFEREQAPAEQ